MSYRLLDGTSKFNELHEIVRDIKSNLETEVGPVDGVSAKMGRGIVSRLSVAAEVQKLCSLAVEKADEFMASKSTATIDFIGKLLFCPFGTLRIKSCCNILKCFTSPLMQRVHFPQLVNSFLRM